MTVDDHPGRSRNARAQARHRAKRKAYIEQLEDTVTKLQAALALSPEQHASLLPSAQARIRQLEIENCSLKREIEALRNQLATIVTRQDSASDDGFGSGSERGVKRPRLSVEGTSISYLASALFPYISLILAAVRQYHKSFPVLLSSALILVDAFLQPSPASVTTQTPPLPFQNHTPVSAVSTSPTNLSYPPQHLPNQLYSSLFHVPPVAPPLISPTSPTVNTNHPSFLDMGRLGSINTLNYKRQAAEYPVSYPLLSPIASGDFDPDTTSWRAFAAAIEHARRSGG